MQKIAVFSKKIIKIKNINHFFPDLIFTDKKNKKQANAIAGWGLRPTTKKARKYATENKLPFISLEDGFLRSVGLGLEGYSPLSLIADSTGIYYDARFPSELEKLIKDKSRLVLHLDYAIQAIKLITDNELTKYNHAPNFTGFSNEHHLQNEKVLVIDQTVGDMSVKYGDADHQTFLEMLDKALQENPTATIYVKTHTDVINGYKEGFLTSNLNKDSIVLLSEDINPISLLKQIDKVYVVTSHMGFEALLLGKEVITFGLPWYAGWGVTDDRHKNIKSLKNNERRTEATITELFVASYILYCQYINPYTGKKGTIFDVINYLTKIKKLNNKLRGSVKLVGFSFWKKHVLLPYLNLPSVKIHFYSINKFRKIENDNKLNHDVKSQKILIWGQGKKSIIPIIQNEKFCIMRIEDGFIRSIGLGSNLVMPYSLVIDGLGIYFNSQKISELESLLATRVVTKQEQEKAKSLQKLIIETKISKYNVGNEKNIKPNHEKRKIILIPGQVEDDASIIFGSPIIKTNLELVQMVRKKNQDAYIIYKPHPDVLSGNRIGEINKTELKKYVNDIIEFADIIHCIEQVDEIHTITSLAGFEALIRHKKVVCYGQPFYSGWGLTTDLYPNSLRRRILSLDELIYIVMYEYSIYIHPKSLDFTDPETLVKYLNNEKLEKTRLINQFWLKKQLQKIKHILHLIVKIKFSKN
ncbi:capsular polysaccharide biosynthesis protein [Gilliamella sp. B14448G11]|uniref:capsular polysaccharide biosynthesis protein n=1 Tax=unclassified Gilliamella TaxID=2685620 RepID=UPI0018DB605C|nr:MULTISPECIES: capsular polysaccharide biosynthesis protein [unclassified Gilliamella]MBI0028374.1 capsular polysaccharide biosynthesis protein [Gilliamella sp. B14448G7]MBI0036093.1 capsular polysaccharide biosynthesis protein [Gilliamella sp. B14448G11]MBI0042827.1 capsular polysaccharide biosynthesis protein [Gilliamella sp. B14448G12]